MRIQRVVTMALVQDMDRAVRFYRDTLGFTVEYEEEDWAVFSEGVGLMVSPEPIPEDSVNLNSVLITIQVEDTRAAFGELTEKGVAFLVPPTDVGGAVSATFRDSEGNLIQLIQHAAL
jgi:predicted enzyme related to lactoylglutathione lyase